MTRIACPVTVILMALASSSRASDRTEVSVPDIAPRQVSFVIELDAQRSFSITGLLIWENGGGPRVDSAEVHVGGQTLELEVVPPSVYFEAVPIAHGFAAPMAAFDVYELSDDLMVIIGDSTFGDKAGPFEPCFAALDLEDGNDAGWVSRVAFGLWGTTQVFDLIMPDLTPQPIGGTPIQTVLPQYTCDLQIETEDEPHRFPGVLPDSKPVVYVIVQKDTGEIEVAVVCPEQFSGIGTSVSVCGLALPLASPGGPPGNLPAFTAAIFRYLVSAALPSP